MAKYNSRQKYVFGTWIREGHGSTEGSQFAGAFITVLSAVMIAVIAGVLYISYFVH